MKISLRKPLLSILSILSLLTLHVMATQPGKAGSREQPLSPTEVRQLHRGKAGFYLRLATNEREHRAEFYLRHPLVDAVVVNYGWVDMEPERGRFEFSGIERFLELAHKHGKGVVLGFSTYGQSPGNQPTPEWLYQTGVKGITFPGGGVARGRDITVPKAWAEPYLTEYRRLIKALAERFDGDPRIWYIVPGFGHIGNLNAQPSKDGGPAFNAEGWTPEIWFGFCHQVRQVYQEAFTKTPLMLKSANALLRNRDRKNFLPEANELIHQMALKGVSVIGFGLEPEVDLVRENGAVFRIANLKEETLAGTIRTGLGDDWPLWVPEERRQKEHFLEGRDEAGLEREIAFAFGGVEGLPETQISVMYVLHPELGASHPEMGEEQNKRVYRLLEEARRRLKSEDPIEHR